MQDALLATGLGANPVGTGRHARLATLAVFLLGVLLSTSLQAGPKDASAANIRQLRSRHIRLHTDLDAIAARKRLTAMENALERSSKYWGRALPGKIEVYLVDRLDRWSPDALPLKEARIVLEHIGGGTAIDWPTSGRHVKMRTCVYATNRRGIAEHEIVHAYCFQTFGRAGPDWYREGMAEVLARSTSDPDAICREETIELLQSADVLSVTRIVNRPHFTRKLRQTVERFQSLPGQQEAQLAFDLAGWSSADGQALEQTRLAYAESWALCHLLCQSPNYQEPFRRLGRALLKGDTICPETALRPFQREIDFELRQFQQHLADGYRIDLCPWPWKAEFAPLAVDESIALTLAARAGYQATQIMVHPGEQYRFESSGNWSLLDGGRPLDADGGPDGWGCVQGVVLDEFQLSAPFSLQNDGCFRPSRAGRLYLRCRDRWHELADNHGQLQVRLTRTN